MAKKFTLKTSRNGAWETFYPKAHWDNIKNKPNNIINGADTGYTPVTGSLIYYEGGAFKTIAPSSDNEILTLENGIPKWKDIDTLTLDTYRKWEIGTFRGSDTATVGQWGKIFECTWDGSPYSTANFIFDIQGTDRNISDAYGRLKLKVYFGTSTSTPTFDLEWIYKSLRIPLGNIIALHEPNSYSVSVWGINPIANVGIQAILVHSSDLAGYLLSDQTYTHYSYQFFQVTNEDFVASYPSGEIETSCCMDSETEGLKVADLEIDKYGEGANFNLHNADISMFDGRISGDKYISTTDICKAVDGDIEILKSWKDQANLWNSQAGYWWKAFDVTNDVGSKYSTDFTFTYKENYNVGENCFGILKLRANFSNQTATLSWVNKTSEIDVNRFVAIINGTTTSLYIQNIRPNGYCGSQLALQTKSNVTGDYTVEDYASFHFYSIRDNTSPDMLQTLPSGTQYVSTMLDQTLTTNSVRPAYNSLSAIDYNKEYGYVVDNHDSAGTTWGKIFSYEVSKIYAAATFVFDVNYGYYSRERVGRLKLHTRMGNGTSTLAEAYLYFESKSESLDLSTFKVRRYDNKAEIYVKTAFIYEGVSLKLVQVLDINGKTYLQDTEISNFTLHNVTNPTLTNTDIDNLSGEVTIPTLIPQTLNGNELTINGQTYNSTWFDDWNKLRALIYEKNDEVVLDSTINMKYQSLDFNNSKTGTPETLDMTTLNLIAFTGHLPSNDKTMPDKIQRFTRNTGLMSISLGLAYPNTPYTARISSVTVTGDTSDFINVETNPNNPSALITCMIQTDNMRLGEHPLTARIVDEFGVTINYTYTAIIER